MPKRIYCIDCQVFFRKEKTGFTVDYAPQWKLRGDLYQCPKCGKQVYGDFGEPF